MPKRMVLTVKGLDSIQRGFRALAQPELTRMAKPVFQVASQTIFIPEVKAQARSASKYSPGPGRNRGGRGQRGPLAKNVTTRLMPSRSAKKHDLLFAYTTGPRAWYRAFVIKGTRRHSLAKDAKLRSGKFQDRTPIHPGSKPNDFVARAQQAGEARFMQHFAQAVVNAWASHARRP